MEAPSLAPLNPLGLPLHAPIQQIQDKTVGYVAEGKRPVVDEPPSFGRSTPARRRSYLPLHNAPTLQLLKAASDCLPAGLDPSLQIGLQKLALAERGDELIDYIVSKESHQVSRLALHIFLSKEWTKIAALHRAAQKPDLSCSMRINSGGRLGTQ